jgi:phospholipase C
MPGSILVLALALAACGGGGGSPPGPRPPNPSPAPSASAVPTPEPSGIDHVVIIFQENRSPDNLFHGLPGADTNVTSGVNSRNQLVPLEPVRLAVPFDLGHTHRAFETDWNGGLMNGFDHQKGDCLNCPPPDMRAYSYVVQSDVQPYFDLAERYVFGDRMFQTNQGPSFPAHQFIISGTSVALPVSGEMIAENPKNSSPQTKSGGCDSPAGTLVALIDPEGKENLHVFPCFDHPTLMDLLDAKGVSWHYYQPQHPPVAGLWTLDAIEHIAHGPDVQYISAPSTNILKDVANGTLPHVSWVIPTYGESDHPGSGNTGPSWVATVVNAIGESPYWRHTAVIVLWDDWGGWYDHVPPPAIRNSYELGLRVPLIVISPFAKRAHVSHVQYEFGSILKFVEETFGLGNLGYTDENANDLADCFDYKQPVRKYEPVQAPYDRAYFLSRRTDPRPLDDE